MSRNNRQKSPSRSLRSLRSLIPQLDDKEKPKTGIAHLAHASTSPPTIMRISPVYNFSSSMSSLVRSRLEQPLDADDFADTDSSLAVSAEEVDAETIYLIIQGYDADENDRDDNNVFHELFSGSSPDSTATEQLEKSVRLPEPDMDIRASQHSQQSLSSGELLGKLEGGLRDSRASHATDPSNALHISTDTDSSKKRFSLTTANLTAGIDRKSTLPFTIYKVKDKLHPRTRAPRAEVPPVPPVPPAGHVSSSDSHSASTTDSNVGNISAESLSPRKLSKEPLRHSAFGVSPIPEHPTPRDTPREPPVERFQTRKEVHDESLSPVSSPASSVVRDSEERKRHHLNMFADNESGEWQDPAFKQDIEKGYVTRAPHVVWQPWVRWTMVMVMGLVAVPVYFFLAAGFLDRPIADGGSLIQNYMATPDKIESFTLGYQRKYTRVQKIASLCIGLIWLAIVFAMIAVAFGLRARFH